MVVIQAETYQVLPFSAASLEQFVVLKELPWLGDVQPYLAVRSQAN